VAAVVGAAIVRDGRVLAARRTFPAEAAGRWELPGGKVEAGETRDDALVREVTEELGCTVAVTHWLHGEVAIGDRHVLSVAVVRLVAGEPRPREHDAVRWLGPDELGTVDWLEPDRPFLPHVADRLRAGMMGRVRGIFFDEDDARAAVARLHADGYDADLRRDRLAGEDDDEDHPWAVRTDAPELVLELLVDEYDGWLDADDETAGPAGTDRPEVAPLELPTEPRKIKRPH
jgi:mutator protein MutT